MYRRWSVVITFFHYCPLDIYLLDLAKDKVEHFWGNKRPFEIKDVNGQDMKFFQIFWSFILKGPILRKIEFLMKFALLKKFSNFFTFLSFLSKPLCPQLTSSFLYVKKPYWIISLEVESYIIWYESISIRS